MSKLKELKSATSLSDVAILLNCKPGMLSNLLYIRSKVTLYRKFEIDKRYGGKREILAPAPELKLIQHRLSKLLQKCLNEINISHGHEERKDRHGIAHGFKPHHTIMTNGRPHIARRWVFNVDLHDFFGSINFGRVRGFFLKDNNFQLHRNVATVLAQIACFDNKLPQGSPCSPVISNLIGHCLDIPLAALAARVSVTYTRYADDLTFSSNEREFPAQIAERRDSHTWVPGYRLAKIVNKSGFEFNPQKTRMQYCNSRQEVTGLTVNKKVNVPSSYRYKVRAMAHSLFRSGQFKFIYKKKDENGIPMVVKQSAGKKTQLRGMLSYIDQVDCFNKKIREDNGLEPIDTRGREDLFRRFLYFDIFYSLEKPIVVCEGKTDNVYLSCAIKNLATSYPNLIAPSFPPKLKINFYKYSDRRTSELTFLKGGVNGICEMLLTYSWYVKKYFKAKQPKHPVIVLIDNDSGANRVYGAVAKITKNKKPTGSEEFIHVTKNLYVVPTPITEHDKKGTKIEDFFDKKTLTINLNNKTFKSDMKKGDSDAHYGKVVFAHSVVAKKASEISFEKFRKILDRVVKALDDYETKSKLSSVNNEE